jgi:hypothetical protein
MKRFLSYVKHYAHKFVGGTGKHGGAILPDSLRWLWRTESAKEEAR